MPSYGVASLFKMLTYARVCCAFSSSRALTLNVICLFEMACNKPEKLLDQQVFISMRGIIDKADEYYWHA